MFTKAMIVGWILIGVTGTTAAVGLRASQVIPPQRLDLGQQLGAGKLRAVKRSVTALPARAGAVHVSTASDNGVVWIEGSEFGSGTIEAEIRGRDVFQQSFVGIAFHRQDDQTYEAVYVRPFNFRSDDPGRRQHAVQYIAVPDYDWPRLRQEFPEEFENPVDGSVSPTDWVSLRLVATGKTVQVYVGARAAPALEVRKLGTHEAGQIGLWVGNGSDGDFANIRITHMK